MTYRSLTAVALTSAMLAIAAPAQAGSGSTTTSVPGNTSQVEQLGPKYHLDPKNRHTRSIAATTRAMLGPVKTLKVEEFGPKYLLGYELKADG